MLKSPAGFLCAGVLSSRKSRFFHPTPAKKRLFLQFKPAITQEKIPPEACLYLSDAFRIKHVSNSETSLDGTVRRNTMKDFLERKGGEKVIPHLYKSTKKCIIRL